MADSLPIGSGSNTATAGNQSTSARKADPLIGTVLAERYRILETVGRGGMGVVYKARHEFMDRFVALKMLLPQVVIDDKSIARFQKEAQAASRINHPNIIALHDFGLADGLPYLVMDYLEGCSLADLIKRDGQLGVQRTVTIFLQICEALGHAHKQGVIHRDLKPGNIMLINHDDDPNFVKVVDFGVAKMYEADGEEAQRLTQTGELFGSPVYMSPEQCRGDQLDPSSDIYSLGCVLYETLTGKLPLVGKNAVETIAKHMNTMPQSLADARPDLYIPDWLESAVFRAIAKDPKDRHQNMMELYDELMVGFTSTCSSSQLQALPPRLLGAASMSSIKIRTMDMPKPGASGARYALSRDAGPSTKARVLWLIIGGSLLLGGGALALNAFKSAPPPVQAPSASSVDEDISSTSSCSNGGVAAVDASKGSEETKQPAQCQFTAAKEAAAKAAHKAALSKKQTRKPAPKTSKGTAAGSVPTPVQPAYTPPVTSHHKHKPKDANQYYYDFSSKENNFGDPKGLPTN